MLILAIDTALGAVAACVYDTEQDHVLASERLILARGHAEALVPLLERLAAHFSGSFDGIERVAVTTGPGSFTGIRVGVAAARAIGVARNIKVVGITTFSAFAAPLLGRDRADVACVVDARHGNVFIETFDHTGAIVHGAAVVPVRLAAVRLGDTPTILTGPGAPLVAIEAWSLGRKVDVGGETVSPPIDFVARLGAIADLQESPANPFYLKAADVTHNASNLTQARL
ncbi:MAG: tRNA (adenosine(37)-N6)-threonylcarbamoyltransferase complex dimerization subunit type 1 TsaB [Beijerinckiaceae bacterium]|nr:tRNA (adenosine(37)-N6)-threonylcarbamoyltransferase complex dimerization subunit type 1 TsaB [Beijerinckiaceae bacterium]